MVTVKPLTVHWHQDSSPLYSACFQRGETSLPVNCSARFATAGGDNNARLWRLKTPADPADPPEVLYLATLAKHEGAVNVVRFSEQGTLLASAGDDGIVCLWAKAGSGEPVKQFGAEFDDLESWRVVKKCRSASFGEIYDLAWSPSGRFLAATSMDKVVSIIDTVEGTCIKALRDHKHYVQGVAWDPKNEFLATQSSDQTVLVYAIKNDAFETPVRIEKREVEGKTLQFYSESFSSFFRRLSFSPDGSFLVVPAGLVKHEESSLNGVYIYVRGDWKTARAVLPLPKESLAVKFNPLALQLRHTSPAPYMKLPYRFMFAVATLTGVFVYDTEQLQPLGMAANLHYSSITDLAWSPDGRTLLITSVDGFCSCIQLDKDDLGPVYEGKLDVKVEAPSTVTNVVPLVETTPKINTLMVRKKVKEEPSPEKPDSATTA